MERSLQEECLLVQLKGIELVKDVLLERKGGQLLQSCFLKCFALSKSLMVLEAFVKNNFVEAVKMNAELYPKFHPILKMHLQ